MAATPGVAMPDSLKAAFDAVGDTTKQLITLSTAIVTLTVTFGTDVFRTGTGATSSANAASGIVLVAWVVYLVSIVFGLWAHYAVAGSLGRATAATPLNVYSPNIAIPVAGQQVTFLIATVLIVVFGVRALGVV